MITNDNNRENLTPRESILMSHEDEQEKRQYDYALRTKEMELEEKRLENNVAIWFKIPIMIVDLPRLILRLPLLPFIGIALTICIAKGKEPSERFWKLLG